MTTSPRVPVLCAGDRLSRAEFERRYAAMPDLKKAELIEGVVYMGSPASFVRHGVPQSNLSAWLTFYRVCTPGVFATDNTTVRLDLDDEPQPDLLLRIPEHAGGSSRVAADGYLQGPPELVVEVAASSASYDLHDKLHAYRRIGVREYLVHRVDDGEVDWLALRDGAYVRRRPDPQGHLHSDTFPGLCLPVAALLRGDLPALRDAVEQACETAEHATFVSRLRG